MISKCFLHDNSSRIALYIIFHISTQKHRLWVFVLSRNVKNIKFLSENFQFLEVKFSIYLNRRVFMMISKCFLHDNSSKRGLKGSRMSKEAFVSLNIHTDN